MNTKLLFVSSLLGGALVARSQSAPFPQPPNYQVVERGPHWRTWQCTQLITNLAGNVLSRRHSYQEIQAGLYRLTGSNQWVECSEQIAATATGAQVTNCQFGLEFLGDAAAPGGVVDLTLPNVGAHLAFSVIGLSYLDRNTGSNVLFVLTTNSQGQILPTGNEALYPRALGSSDILYRVSKAGLEQFILLHEQLPDPGLWGISSPILEVWTELVNSPVPEITPVQLPEGQDSWLDFGQMVMTRGFAFALGDETNKVAVLKQWLHSEDNRTVLVEQIQLDAILPQLQTLPPFSGGSASLRPAPGSALYRLASHRQFPPRKLANLAPRSLGVAAAPPASKAVAIDFSIITSQTNLLLKGDSTYFITNGIILAGSNTFEPGCVLKFSSNASIAFSPTAQINWQGQPARPILMTAKDDNSCGDLITGSTGTPTNFYASPALNLTGLSSVTLTNFRIAFANQAIVASCLPLTVSLYDGQIVNCGSGIYIPGQGTLNLRNMLFASFQTALSLSYCGASAQNVTFSALPGGPPNYTPSFLLVAAGGPTNSMSVNATNCIFANFSSFSPNNPAAVSGGDNGFYNNGGATFGAPALTVSSSPFQVAGAGYFYLNDAWRNAGCTNLDARLLSDLRQRTTYAPLICSNVTLSAEIFKGETI
ncbi:exported hypothetical protein [Verrucomicrobia bacterium]|nr:exported hypothetical protein [Verrucomicrobiota bacterium]